MTQRPIEEIVDKIDDLVFKWELDFLSSPAREELAALLAEERRQARQEGYNAGLADGTGKPLLAIEAANERLREVVGEFDTFAENLVIIESNIGNFTLSAIDARPLQCIKDYLRTTLETERRQAIDPVRVGMLRQWINEDRIINNSAQKLITDGEIMFWLTSDQSYLDITPNTSPHEGT
jgi:hypothetical protein